MVDGRDADRRGGLAADAADPGDRPKYRRTFDAAAELLSGENPDIQVTVGEAGTSGGFEVFCQGQTDISDASRPIEEDEVAACEEGGVEFTELQVAIDALTIVVHPDLAVDCLTIEQVIQLWEPKSDITNWSD